MTTIYLTLQNIQTEEVSVHAGFYTAGFPAMTAFAGFGHAFELRFKAHLAKVVRDDPSREDSWDIPEEKETQFKVSGVIPVITAYHMAAGPAKRVSYETETKSKAAPLAFAPLADMNLDIVFRVEASLSVSELKHAMSHPAMTGLIQTMRLSGGSLFWNGTCEVAESLEVILANASTTAYILEDCTPTLKSYLETNAESTVVEALDRLTSRLYAKSANDSLTGYAPNAEELPYEPRHVALAMGYRALEEKATVRNCSKNGNPHLFVEPVVGLGRVRMLASVKAALKREENVDMVWAYQAPTEDGYFLIRGESALTF